MNMTRTIVCTLAAVFAAHLGSFAAEGGKDWWEIRNRLRLEYDDNIYERGTDTQDSFKIIEEVEFHANLQLTPQSFLGLRYRPSFTYWTDRDPDDSDLHHDLDVVFNHRFSPTTTLGFKNKFRIAEQAELIEDGVQVREQDDYTMNVTDLNLQHGLTRNLFTRLGGRYKILEYDRDDVADTDNYDQFAGGVSVGYAVSPDMSVLGEYRYQQTDYDFSGDPSRDSDSQFAGVNIEKTFNPNLIGSFRVGIQAKTFDADTIDDEDNPYFDLKLTAIPSPDTRVSLGAGFSMYEADVFPYTSQDRTLAFLSVAHDLSARVSLYLSGSYQLSDYSGDQSLTGDAPDGEEEVLQASVRTSYMINRNNWVDFSYNYMDLGSDLREEFDRSRLSVGWRTNL